MKYHYVLLSAAVLAAWPMGAALAQEPVGAAPASTPYRIHAGDELNIFVWGEERLQRNVRVLPDGTFSFPLVGQVNAQNALPIDLEKKITAGLAPQYRNAVPQVTVSVVSPAGLQFSIIGKVRSPGVFTPGRYVNALEALSLAGGPNEFAQLNNVVIVRKTSGGVQAIRVRLNDALRGSVDDISSSKIPQIQAGDTIIVP